MQKLKIGIRFFSKTASMPLGERCGEFDSFVGPSWVPMIFEISVSFAYYGVMIWGILPLVKG